MLGIGGRIIDQILGAFKAILAWIWNRIKVFWKEGLIAVLLAVLALVVWKVLGGALAKIGASIV